MKNNTMILMGRSTNDVRNVSKIISYTMVKIFNDSDSWNVVKFTSIQESEVNSSDQKIDLSNSNNALEQNR